MDKNNNGGKGFKSDIMGNGITAMRPTGLMITVGEASL